MTLTLRPLGLGGRFFLLVLVTMIGASATSDEKQKREKSAAGLGGRPAAREPGLGTGRGGDVTGDA